MSDYAHSLAAAARSNGGASLTEWLNLLTPGADAATRCTLRPLADRLATLSGYDESALPLFDGRARFESGEKALRHTHAQVFGSDLSIEELLSLDVSDAAKIPVLLAKRLATRNQGSWTTLLAHWHRTYLPLLPSRGWESEQTPSEWVLPPGVPATDRLVLDASLDTVIVAFASELIEQTKAALHLGAIPGDSIYSQAARCLDVLFLVRYFRKMVWRGLETMQLHSKKVGRGGHRYVSSSGYAAWCLRQKAQQAWIEKTYVVDKQGKSPPRPLSDVVMTNKAKRARLTAVLAGIEQLAQEDGLHAAMVTITLAPEWHPNPSHGRGSWGGTEYTPDNGVKHAAVNWAKFLRDLSNVGIRAAGLRVVEPHQDGCPHMHALLYFHPEAESLILSRLAGTYDVTALKVRTLVTSPFGKQKSRSGTRYNTVVTHFDEATGRELPGNGGTHRIEFSRINRDISLASSYVQKLVLNALDFDELDEIAKPDAATSAAAHAAGWGYRRFALFGIRASLGLWDALRRKKKLPNGSDHIARLLCQHANNGEYAEFLRTLGGLSSRSGYTIKAIKHTRFTRYGDEVTEVIGMEVYDGSKRLLYLQVREPGRFELVDKSEELEAAAIVAWRLAADAQKEDPPF